MNLPNATGDTLWAVVAGAVLATAGGFVATQLEAALRRRERQRSAAIMFGEMLSSLETIVGIASQSRLRGDPYGSITMRLLRAASRETETYERNRSTLYDLRDPELRVRIYVLMVQLTLALEGVSETSAQIAEARALSDNPALPKDRATANAERRDRLAVERDGTFAYVPTVVGEVTALVAILQPLAKVNFADLEKFSGNPFSS